MKNKNYETKPMYVSVTTLERFKQYCRNNGLKMGFTVNRILTDWLDNQSRG